jgi:hypothetical protein
MAITSPLPFLFEEDSYGDRKAREALFCTFNADLGYFERTVLGITQSAGARITTIEDGRISDPDPRAARNAVPPQCADGTSAARLREKEGCAAADADETYVGDPDPQDRNV